MSRLKIVSNGTDEGTDVLVNGKSILKDSKTLINKIIIKMDTDHQPYSATITFVDLDIEYETANNKSIKIIKESIDDTGNIVEKEI